MADKIVWKDKKHFMFFPISFTNYSVTPDRFLIETGLFTSNYEEIYLYRIIDVKLKRGLGNKIFGTGTVTLISNDATTPAIEIKNIKDPLRVKEMISKMADEERRNRILETDGGRLNFRDANNDGFPDFIS